MLDTEESRRYSYYHIQSLLVVLSVLIRQNKTGAIQYCCKMVMHLSFWNSFSFLYNTPVFVETQNFLLVLFLTATELEQSEIASFKSIFPMSNIECFNFYMWTVNIYVEVNFTGCTVQPISVNRINAPATCKITQKRAS